MAVARHKLQTDITITIELTEDEACALGAIAGYDADAFIKVFKEHMGTHYIRYYEECVPELFRSLRGLDNRVRDFRKQISEIEL